MPIDPKVIERDARQNISDWPATIKHRGRKISVHASATNDVLTTLEGGLLDDMVITCVGVASDFGQRRPQTHDDVELQLSDGTWKLLEVQTTPDFYDPLLPTLQFTLGSPAK